VSCESHSETVRSDFKCVHSSAHTTHNTIQAAYIWNSTHRWCRQAALADDTLTTASMAMCEVPEGRHERQGKGWKKLAAGVKGVISLPSVVTLWCGVWLFANDTCTPNGPHDLEKQFIIAATGCLCMLACNIWFTSGALLR
jgi:hypothetical protein